MPPYAIAIIAFIVAAGVSIAYYQFFYLPEATKNPVFVEAEQPTRTTIVRIVYGASLESNPVFMVPQVATVVLGYDNKVRWVNADTVPHTITTDSDYINPISGKFDSRERPEDEGGAFVMPGKYYEFTFTEPGEYPYHHEPHPWVQGTIVVRER